LHEVRLPARAGFLNPLEISDGSPPLSPVINPSDVIRHLDGRAGGLILCRREWCRRAADRTLALIAFVMLAPLLVLAAILVKLTSRGPAVYGQVRVGKDGALFTLYKLRTMYHNSEAESGVVWSTSGDPRVTPVGRVLRATHIDELPQLINVLRGEMSLIGPRPERPEIVEFLRARIERYEERLAVLPGISGLAQVQLPPDVDLDGVRRKLVCDRYYIHHRGAWLDLRILICTALFFVGIRLHFSRRFLRIAEPLRVNSCSTH
jgi:lipopolysaccharide/colanic/teichoic acid biosynthesis glycosyltransferase